MRGLATHLSAHAPITVFADGSRMEESWPFAVRRFGGLKPLRRRLKGRAVARVPDLSGVVCDSWKSAEHLAAVDVPVVIYAHGNEFPQGPGHERKRERIRRSLGKAAHVVAVSHATAARVRDVLPDAPVHVRPNPVEPLPEPSREDTAWAEGLWPKEAFRCVSLCRLVDWKGVDQAIAAVEGTSAHLVIAGDGPDAARLRDLAGPNVTFTGRIEGGRKTTLLRSAQLYLQPGRRVGDQAEGFGISYIEAGLAGLASIAGQAGGAPDAVIDGETGLVVDGTDTAAVRAALLRCLDAPSLRSQLGEAAERRARGLLWPARAGDVLELLRHGTHPDIWGNQP